MIARSLHLVVPCAAGIIVIVSCAPDPQSGTSGAQTDAQKVASLIDCLAVDGGPKSNVAISAAYKAAEEIKSHGTAAFSSLLAHRDDRRSSIPMRNWAQITVGAACMAILEDLVFPLPSDYQRTLYRTGRDGKEYERLFARRGFTNGQDIEQWLNDRKDWTLERIQSESLRVLIEDEQRIGFATQEAEDSFIKPLVELRATIVDRTRNP